MTNTDRISSLLDKQGPHTLTDGKFVLYAILLVKSNIYIMFELLYLADSWRPLISVLRPET